MNILDRYVWKELGPPFAIGVGVFTFFLFIDRIYQLTNLVITKNVPVHLVLSLLFYILPPFLTLTLPLSLLVAVLLVGGRLAGDFEVTAIRAAGISPLRLFRPFVVFAVLVSGLIMSLTLIVNPWAIGAFQAQLFKILQTRATTGIQERTFSAAFGQVVMYVEEIAPSQLALRGVLVSDERDPKQSRIILAREGRLLSDDASRRITLRFINGSIIESEAADPRRFRLTGFSLYDMNLPLDSPLASASKDDKPERQLALGALLTTAEDLKRQGQIVRPYYVEYHKRFALPVAALVFTMVGFPLGIRTQRGGRAVALTSSFIIVFTYYIVFNSVEGLALGGRLPIPFAMWLPNMAFGLLGLGLMRATTRGVSFSWMEIIWPVWRSIVRRRSGAGASAGRGARARQGWRVPRPRASTFIIDRYLIRQFLLFVCLGLLVGAVLFVVVDLLQTLDRFLRIKPPLWLILQHFAFNMPGEVYKGLPLIVLIATVFLFLTLTRQRELDALKAAGVSLYRVCLPIFLTAFGISVAAILFQEIVLPELSTRAEEVDRVKIRGMPPKHLARQNQIWYRSSETRFLRMVLLDPMEKSIDGLLAIDINGDWKLVDRLDARKAIWTPDGWRVSDGILRTVDAGGHVRSDAFPLRVMPLPEHMNDFIEVQKPVDTLSFFELRAFVAKLRESGHAVGKYLVQLYSRVSFPLVHVIMVLVGIPFALVSPRSGGRAMGIGVAIAIAVSYWMVHSVSLALAQADLLPPVLAAWIANIVFAGLGTALFLNVRT